MTFEVINSDFYTLQSPANTGFFKIVP